MADPMQATPYGADQQNPVVSFFKDPRNLATGLVFLAALAQPRQNGQSSLAAAGERAVGALAFRGGLDKGLRQQRIEDEQRQLANIDQSKKQELAQRQVAIGEQGLGLEQQRITQAERLAREQNANALQLKQTPQAQTPEQAALDAAMAQYYNRMPKGTGSGSAFSMGIDPQMLQDMSKLQWEQEVKQAGLEGRAPDPIKVTNSLMDFMQSVRAASAVPGTHIVRNPDGSIAVETGPISDPAATPPVPGAPNAAPVPFTMAPPGVDFSSTTPQVPVAEPKRLRPRGSNVPSPVMDEIRALSRIPDPQLSEFLKDPRLTKEQLVSVREEIRRRMVRNKALNSSSPGLR